MWYYGFLYTHQENGTSNYVLVDKKITFEYITESFFRRYKRRQHAM